MTVKQDLTKPEEPMQTDKEKLDSALAITHKLRELTTFSKSEQDCREMVAMYDGLKVESVDDKEGLATVHNARMTLKQARIDLDNRRKELKRPLIDAGKFVETEAKKLIGILKPCEEKLQHEEDIVKREKERIEAEAKARREAELRERLEQLATVGVMALPSDVQMWTDEFYAETLTAATADHEKKLAAEAEAKRKAEEEAAKLAEERRKFEEEQRIAREKAEAGAEKQRQAQEEMRRQQEAIEAEKRAIEEAKQRQLREAKEAEEADQRRIEEERRAKEREERLEREKAEAAERARIETEERIKREAEEKAERERVEAEKAARRAARRPWVEKVAKIADDLEAIEVPNGKNCGEKRERVQVAIDVCVDTIRGIIKEDDE